MKTLLSPPSSLRICCASSLPSFSRPPSLTNKFIMNSSCNNINKINYVNYYYISSPFSTKPSSFPLFSSIRRTISPFLSMASSTQSATQDESTSSNDLNGFQLIQAHQEKAARLPPVEEIKTVLDNSVRAMLATFSLKHEGYPSGSMVDFACDAYGSPILAVSSLAVHTKDLLANPKCSLLVAKDPEDRTDLVITVHGDAVSVSSSPLLPKQKILIEVQSVRRRSTSFGQGLIRVSHLQEGAARSNYVIQYALTLVLKGSFKLCSQIKNDGIINLIDKASTLSEFYDVYKG